MLYQAFACLFFAVRIAGPVSLHSSMVPEALLPIRLFRREAAVPAPIAYVGSVQ